MASKLTLTPMTRSFLIAALSLSSSFCLAGGVEEPLAYWTWDKPDLPPAVAELVAPGLQASPLVGQGLHVSYPTAGGATGGFLAFSSADDKFDYSVDSRTDLSPHSDTLSFQLSWETGTSVSVSSITASVASPEKGSPTYAQASLFWMDGQNKVQWTVSDTLYLPEDSNWQTVQFSFRDPFISQAPSQQLLVEVYAWGGTDEGVLKVDNLQVNGSTTSVIPEPSAAILMGSVGLAGLLRRRRK
jgi:hypothetical protein